MIHRAMFLGVLLVPGLNASVFGEVIHVPGDQPSIQAAIKVAADGDRIIVAPGTYFENINLFGKAVTLRSSDGPEVTTIDANGSGTVVRCENEEERDTVIDGFTLTGGSAVVGGGMVIDGSSPTVTNCTFIENSAALFGGGMHAHDSEPLVLNCSFIQNIGGQDIDFGRGGAVYNERSDSTFINCIFRQNTSSYAGGAIQNHNHGRILTLSNCLFVGNTATSGGGLSATNDSISRVSNCTFVGNAAIGANSAGGAIALHESDSTVLNSIFWGNSAEGSSPQMDVGSASTVSVAYSDVQGGQAEVGGDGEILWGPGNIDADPLFVDADGPDDIPGTEDDDLRLSPGSPAIDAANNMGVPADTQDLDGDGDTDEPVPVDLDGNPRFVDDPDTPDTGNPDGIHPIVDMGAYEFGPPDPCADEDGDGRVTICHIPPGNSDNAYTITVSVNALPAHLAHGDHCGACDEDDGLLMGGRSNVIPETVSDGPGRLRRYRR